jgi:biopolymer transport protein ExbD
MAFGGFNEGGNVQPIFIITAPLFHQAVPVDLPQVDATRIENEPIAIQLALDATGGLFLEGVPTARDAVEAHLRAAAPASPELHLRADRATRYEKVADIMAAAQRAGIVKIAFVTEPATR